MEILTFRVKRIIFKHLSLLKRPQNAFRIFHRVLMHRLLPNQLAIESRLELVLLNCFNHRLFHVVDRIAPIEIVQFIYRIHDLADAIRHTVAFLFTVYAWRLVRFIVIILSD